MQNTAVSHRLTQIDYPVLLNVSINHDPGFCTDRSEPQHEYQSCQAEDRKFWRYSSGFGEVNSDTLSINLITTFSSLAPTGFSPF